MQGKNDRSDKGQRSVTASKKELNAIKGRNKKWAKDQDQRPGAGNKGGKYTSNKTHYIPMDPDPVQGHAQDEYHRYKTGHQGDAPLGHR